MRGPGWAARTGPRVATIALAACFAGGCASSTGTGATADRALTQPHPGSPGAPGPAPAASAPPAAPAPSAEFPAYAATAIPTQLVVHSAADPSSSTQRLTNPRPSGAPLTFLLVDNAAATTPGDWLEVFLPVRPNGSTGWVNRTDVALAGVTYRVEVSRSAHRLCLYDRDTLIKELPVGIGTGDTPTPEGRFYLTELLELPDPTGAYGPFAYGLSGFSDVLTQFNGGQGVIGLHGTNEPDAVGTDVSHGCIRLRNDDITALAKMLPLGTPVQISA